jgi:hypothetical protein
MGEETMSKKVVVFIGVGLVCLIAGAVLSRLLTSPKKPDLSEIEKYMDSRDSLLTAMFMDVMDSIAANNKILSDLTIQENHITKIFYDENNRIDSLPTDEQLSLLRENIDVARQRERGGGFFAPIIR